MRAWNAGHGRVRADGTVRARRRIPGIRAIQRKAHVDADAARGRLAAAPAAGHVAVHELLGLHAHDPFPLLHKHRGARLHDGAPLRHLFGAPLRRRSPSRRRKGGAASVDPRTLLSDERLDEGVVPPGAGPTPARCRRGFTRRFRFLTGLRVTSTGKPSTSSMTGGSAHGRRRFAAPPLRAVTARAFRPGRSNCPERGGSSFASRALAQALASGWAFVPIRHLFFARFHPAAGGLRAPDRRPCCEHAELVGQRPRDLFAPQAAGRELAARVRAAPSPGRARPPPRPRLARPPPRRSRP